MLLVLGASSEEQGARILGDLCYSYLLLTFLTFATKSNQPSPLSIRFLYPSPSRTGMTQVVKSLAHEELKGKELTQVPPASLPHCTPLLEAKTSQRRPISPP
jgi:hypothetical protein